jgi:hypothetical protein
MNPDFAADPERSLRDLFGNLVWKHFFSDAGVEQPRIAGYVSDLLADFVHMDNLYRIHGAAGQRLDDVGEMLVESNPLLEAPSFDRERAVRKHVGDFTLFMTGLFPENVAHIRSSKQVRPQSFVDFVKAGKESYAVVSCFDQGEYRDEAPLFRQLSDQFELCIFGLNMVKRDLEEIGHEGYRRFSAGVAGIPPHRM